MFHSLPQRSLLIVAAAGCVVGVGCAAERTEPDRPSVDSYEAQNPGSAETTEVETGTVIVDEQSAQLQPNLVLAVGGDWEAMQLDNAAMLRITAKLPGREEVTLHEAENDPPQLLLVSRREGIKLSGQVLRAGPLLDEAEYRVYLLPPGGVRNEVTQTTVRPATLAELAERRVERERQAAEEAARKARESATSRPANGDSDPPDLSDGP